MEAMGQGKVRHVMSGRGVVRIALGALFALGVERLSKDCAKALRLSVKQVKSLDSFGNILMAVAMTTFM